MTTITVSNSAGLLSALSSAKAGDVISLAPGTYSGINLRNVDFVGSVTITSLDPANPAKLTDLMVRDSSGLKFTNLEFDGSTNAVSSMFQVLGSQNIDFTNIHVHGSLDKNPENDVSHFMIRNSSNVTVVDSRFEQSQHALSFLDSDHLTFSNNSFHDLRTDAIRGGGASYVTITGNSFTDFFPAVGDHPDAIQFWTTNTTVAAHDIVISGNLITRGAGAPVQGIFLRDQVATLPYQNVTINDNMLVGTLWNGIDVQGGRNIAIGNNVVVSLPDQKTWIRLDDVVGAVLTNNSTAHFELNRNTDLVEVGSVKLLPSSDLGLSLINKWFETHSAVEQLYLGNVVTTLAPTADLKIASYIKGTTANDSLTVSGAGTVCVEGLAGNDTITGAVGAHQLKGGLGDDKYVISDARNVIVELVGQGYDTVISSVSVSLSDNVEALRLTGAALTGNGNALDNKLTGNEGQNVLNGMAGNDRIDGLGGDDSLSGGAGNDVLTGGLGADRLDGGDGVDSLWGGEGNDFIVGGAGDDTLYGDAGDDNLSGGDGLDKLAGGIGADRLDGGNGNDRLEGNDGADALFGGAGVDVLIGGRGADQMTGGADGDTFQFDADILLDAGVRDTILDFARGQDRIDVSRIDAKTGGSTNEKFAFIGLGQFTNTAGELRYSVIGSDAYVCGDVNGDGIADFTICVAGTTQLSATDILL